MKRFLVICYAALTFASAGGAGGAALARPAAFMSCDAPSAVVSIRKPADATHAGAGHVALADGASFEVTTSDASFVQRLRTTDRVELCYAPVQRFADAGPTARMAIAGNVRTSDYVFELAYPASAKARAVSTIGPEKYTLLVPTIFDRMSIATPRAGVYLVKTRAADRYRIEVDLAPHCNGANVCSAGAFSGYALAAMPGGRVINPPDGPLTGAATPQDGERAVRLARGTTAFYAETTSGAGGGGNSSLRFVRNGTLYVITSRPSTAAALVATADSAIANTRSRL